MRNDLLEDMLEVSQHKEIGTIVDLEKQLFGIIFDVLSLGSKRLFDFIFAMEYITTFYKLERYFVFEDINICLRKDSLLQETIQCFGDHHFHQCLYTIQQFALPIREVLLEVTIEIGKD